MPLEEIRARRPNPNTYGGRRDVQHRFQTFFATRCKVSGRKWETVCVRTKFDFTGLHDICLADHSVVTGIVEGHLVQRISANGDFSLTFDEVLSYNGGTLGYRGEGSLTRGNWQSNVMTVGLGAGPLAGIHGQGTFVFTGPASLADVIHYVYTP